MQQLQTQAWERNLLALAHEALNSDSHHGLADIDGELLAEAYAVCEQLTAENSRSFYWASALLPEEKKLAARALYAFCRVSDDIVDRGDEHPAARLERWRKKATTHHPPADDMVAVAWADARARYAIPLRYAEQLIDGVARDMVQNRYATFEDLASYCYGVASTVGLMSMHIIGFAGGEAIPYAIKLGVALQLTNILRDIGEDWRLGRCYLPQSELAQFGLNEEDVAAGQVSDRWRTFMRYQIERNRQLYAETMPAIALLDADGRFAIRAAAELYQGILDDIEAHDYDVFTRRAYVSTWGKLRMLPGIWWRSRRTFAAA